MGDTTAAAADNKNDEVDPELYNKLQPSRTAGNVAKKTGGLGRGFPGDIKNGGPYTVTLGAPFTPTMARLVMAYFECTDKLETPADWKSWCSSQGLSEMAEQYERFAYENMERVTQHRLFQACRMRYNVDVAISDLQHGPKKDLFYKITLTGDTRNSMCSAVNYLINCAPKDFKVYLCVPCDYRIYDYLHPKVPINKFIEGGPPEEVEEAKADAFVPRPKPPPPEKKKKS